MKSFAGNRKLHRNCCEYSIVTNCVDSSIPLHNLRTIYIFVTMKAPATSINFALLCFLLSLENASAFLGFSFGNLLFKLHVCTHVGPLGCKTDCDKPFPPGPRKYCEGDCYSSSHENCSSASLENFSQSETYTQCMNYHFALCKSETSDSDTSYYTGNDAASSEGGTSSSNGIPTATSRMSLLPYFVAATVATMFLMLYVWSNRVSSPSYKNQMLREFAATYLIDLILCSICFSQSFASEQGTTTP